MKSKALKVSVLKSDFSLCRLSSVVLFLQRALVQPKTLKTHTRKGI